MKYIVIILLILQTGLLPAQQVTDVIPKPQMMQKKEGVFRISSATYIVASESLSVKAKQLKQLIEPALGFSLTLVTESKRKNRIELKLDKALASSGTEGYQLDISSEKITISAFNERGLFWGIQTLRQLFSPQILRQATVRGIRWEVPCMKINDLPRFKWRGLMLDCSRTFIAKEQIKKYIEVMSFFKMNVLHMHLTDDQGWRLEIKKYPELTSICSKFDSSFHEPKEYEGFYSQDDIKELVEFAAQRNVQIVPEIEMPGHTLEVFAAYPQLSCKGDTLKIHPWLKGAGVHNDVLCAGQ